MLSLVLLTIGLSVASCVLILLLHYGFVRGISWFDDRSTQREHLRDEAHRQFGGKRRAATNNPAPTHDVTAKVVREDDEEWAEYIDV